MDEAFLRHLTISAVSAVIGFAFLAYWAWTWLGRSPKARKWMNKGFGADWFDERMTVLGAPVFGLLCLCFSAVAAPAVGLYLALIAVPLAVPLLILMFVVGFPFIPLPNLIYPPWARPLRERNRRTEQGMKEYLRSHRRRDRR